MHPPRSIRSAQPADHEAFTRFVAELGHDDPVPGPERWSRDMMPHTFFLEDAGRKVGYAFVEEYGDMGWVRHVVVDPEARGRGVGRGLMHAIAARLHARGCTRWELNVKHDNDPARRLYQSFGMTIQYATSVVRIDWDDALGLPADDDVTARRVDPSDDADVERALGLPVGQVARLRSTPDQVLVQLRDASGSVRGFARFDPAFPGAFPFRVLSPTHAGTLLRALHPHRLPDRMWIQLVIEDDAATTHRLRQSGARNVFEILHYAGDVPRG